MACVRAAIVLMLAAMSAAVCGRAATPDPDPRVLARGEFVWHPEVAPSGPLVVVVSLDEQRAYVYRNGIAIGVTMISSGRKGHETPTGVFTILQKQAVHYSDKYDDAPMPFMERLTWDGVAMHGGSLPGFPASHGCIRLPHAFARELFAVTRRGVTVVVADAKSSPAVVVHPAMLAPVTASGDVRDTLASEPEDPWPFAYLPPAPVSILVSTASNIALVFRDGKLIARTRFDGDGLMPVGGSVLYVMGEGLDDAPSPLDPARPRHRWSAYPLPTRDNPAPRVDAAGAFRVPPDFARRLYDLLVPGTTVVVTDLPAVRPAVDSASHAVLESSGTSVRSPR